MTVLRHYRMKAAAGREQDLRAALITLAGQLRPLDGYEGVELFADPSDHATYIFIEHWRTIDDHKAGGQALGKDAFASVMAALAEPPEGLYLEPVPIAGADASA
ncbi:hypothetical protein sphantq_04413 (plasmid) [Sphingobium sp. AntQ-1]|uniref:putative quinol monooxygenase n=1 Tax=Sphingobium sp. AntQ-1 TaxID=2930091 RepID=UPI00234FB07A|nr:antibiotic biosynthesis monooxygenase family protein [Sphingobium sp. AntQ-1]WCP15923.1 hypothetical protein sphantq_04413 [Sphingobium sp. AntQ-1]